MYDSKDRIQADSPLRGAEVHVDWTDRVEMSRDPCVSAALYRFVRMDPASGLLWNRGLEFITWSGAACLVEI